jgi:hypothetical protein
MENTTTITLSQVAVNLGLVFAAGLGVQQLIQVLDGLFSRDQLKTDKKKAILGLVSVLCGVMFSLSGLRVISAIVPSLRIWAPTDVLATNTPMVLLAEHSRAKLLFKYVNRFESPCSRLVRDSPGRQLSRRTLSGAVLPSEGTSASCNRGGGSL